MDYKILDKASVTTWDTPRMKLFGVELHKLGERGSDGTLLVRGYFTSDNKDMYGDIITRKATERALPNYRKWGNIRYMHMPRPVAKVTAIGTENGLEWNEVEIKVIDPQAVFEVENGLLTALSVGILVMFDDVDFLDDGGLLINDYTLAEISLVDHPANYDAFLKGIKGIFTSIPSTTAINTLDEIRSLIKSAEVNNTTEEKMSDTEELNAENTEVSVEKEVSEESLEETSEQVENDQATEENKSVDETSEDGATEEVVSERTLDDVFIRLDALEASIISELTRSLSDMLIQLTANTDESKSAQVEISAEVQSATEQTEDENLEEEDKAALPVERKAAVQATSEIAPEANKKVESKDALKNAIKSYFSHN